MLDPIPPSSLLHLDHFADGTPRAEIARLRRRHRLLWQDDGYERGGHWLVLQRDDIDCVLDTPDRFDITRDPAHTRRNDRTFGNGPHFCIGHHPARTNLEGMTAERAARGKRPHLLEPPVHFRSNSMDGFETMRVGFERA